MVDFVSLNLVFLLLLLSQLGPFDGSLPRAALFIWLTLVDAGEVPVEEAVAGDLAAALVVPCLGELEVTLAQFLEFGRSELFDCG